MENSQRSKLVHFYKKTSAQSHVGGGGDASLGDGHWHGVETQEFFNFAAGASRLTNTNEPLRTSLLRHFGMHAASRAFGYCRHITVKRLNEVSMRSPHQILIWTRRSVGITSEAIIRLKKERQLRGWVKDFVSV